MNLVVQLITILMIITIIIMIITIIIMIITIIVVILKMISKEETFCFITFCTALYLVVHTVLG